MAGDRVDQLRRPVELGEQPQRRARVAVLGVVEIGEACSAAPDRAGLIAALQRDGVDVSNVERRA